MEWPHLPSESHRSASGAEAGPTRRGFLAAVGAAVFAGACRRSPFNESDFSVPARSAVGLFAAASYSIELADVIMRGFRELGVNVSGRRVFLKPNMVEYEPGTAINTHPHVVAGTAIACRRAGAAEVVVGEGPGHRRDIEYLLATTGLYEQLKEHKLKFVDLNHDDVRVVPLRSWFTGLRELALPVELLRSDFVISLPKLKTHHWAGMTCSMKNLFGVVPGAVYGWPKNLLHMRGIPGRFWICLQPSVRSSRSSMRSRPWKATARSWASRATGVSGHGIGLAGRGRDVRARDRSRSSQDHVPR